MIMVEAHLSGEGLTRVVRRAPSLPMDQDRTEVRILSAIITTGFAYMLLAKPVCYMWMVKGSAIWKAASAATLPNWLIALVFVLAFVATLPHLFSLLFWPQWLHCKLPRKMAGYAAAAAGVLWLYLAVNVLSTRSSSLVFLYIGNMFACFVVGWAYGFSVNAQQLRERTQS